MNKSNITIKYLLDNDFAFMGSDWVEDKTVKDGAFPGHRYNGEVPCINCNDFFFWGCADGEEITEEDLPDLNKAIDDCNGNVTTGVDLWVARKRKMRPQGPCYSFIDKEFWPLFDACGEEREVGLGNPCKPGEYKRP